MTRIEVNLLPVGQGAMNLIEIYNMNDQLVHLSLIDCGFDRTRPVRYSSLPDCTAKSVDYAAEKMQQRFTQGGDVYIDYVLITHRDTDHWILFDNLLEKLFGTKEVTGFSENIYYLQKNIDPQTAEDFFANTDSQLYLYTRTHSSSSDRRDVRIEYEYRIDAGTTDVPKSAVYFQDNMQNVSAVLLLDLSNESCTFRSADLVTGIPILDVRLVPCPDTKPTELKIAGTHNKNTYTYDGIFPIPESLETLWDIWTPFLHDVAASDHRFDEILRLDAILEDGFSHDGFLHYTPETIMQRLTEHQQLQKIVGLFLWGGYIPADQGPRNQPSGVGKLRMRSELLSVCGAKEVVPGDKYCLSEPFYLDILERLEPERLIGIRIRESEPASQPAILRNGTSAVSLLNNAADADFQKFLFAGDATIHTLYAMFQNNLVFIRNSIWTAPHHGSYTTSKGKYAKSEQGSPEYADLFPFLLHCFEPMAMVIQSGYLNRHGHPNITFFRWIKKVLSRKELECTAHYVYVNQNDTNTADWKLGLIDFPLYSCVSSLTPSPDEPQADSVMHSFRTTPDDNTYVHFEQPMGGLPQSAGSPARRLPSVNPVDSGPLYSPPQAIPSPGLFFCRT